MQPQVQISPILSLTVSQEKERDKGVWFASLPEGSPLFDLTVDEDHSFYVVDSDSFASNCRSRCKCSLVIASTPRAPEVVRVTNQNPEIASGRKLVGRTPSPEERATIDDLRARINYHRRRIETAPSMTAKRTAIMERKQANAELIQYLQAKGIRDVPMLDVSDVISGRQIEADVAQGLALRGLDGVTLALADAKEWDAIQQSLLTQIAELLNEGP
jgi:hypothetical protein